MSNSLLIFVLFGCTFASIVPNRESRIVGGKAAVGGQFPYVGAIRYTENRDYYFLCACGIISDRYVLTSAYCVNKRDSDKINVVTSTIYRYIGGTAYFAQFMTIHPEYNEETLAFNFALIRTSQVMWERPSARPAPLNYNHIDTAKGAVVAGWGKTSYPGNEPQGLHFINVDIISNDVCRSNFSGSYRDRINDATICSVSPVGQGVCVGDTGSPLVLDGQIIGIVSWGIPCGLGMPDVFGRISSVNDWIGLNMIEH